MKQKKPFYKKWWFWVLVFLFLLVMGNSNTKMTKTEDPTPSTEIVEEPQEVTDPIQTAIDNQHFKYSDLETSNSNGTIKISLHYDDSSWDETSFCNSCLTDYINICSELYSNDDINMVEYSVFVDLIDSKGNVNPNKGFSMRMSKSAYTTYTWENMAFKADSYKQIESDSEIYIYPGIKQNVDFTKMYYKG